MLQQFSFFFFFMTTQHWLRLISNLLNTSLKGCTAPALWFTQQLMAFRLARHLLSGPKLGSLESWTLGSVQKNTEWINQNTDPHWMQEVTQQKSSLYLDEGVSDQQNLVLFSQEAEHIAGLTTELDWLKHCEENRKDINFKLSNCAGQLPVASCYHSEHRFLSKISEKTYAFWSSKPMKFFTGLHG